MTFRPPRKAWPAAALAAAALGLAGCGARPEADTVHAAVAANFAAPFEVLADEFAAASGHQVTVTTGSTGGLYAQIVAGAPFEVLLAADAERPRRLVAEGHAVAGSRFTYARGRIALWRPERPIADGPAALAGGDGPLAMANPATAPYGRAARQALESLGLWPAVAPRVVLGSDVGQTYQFLATGNAALGFVALSQLDDAQAAAAWPVPESLHEPIDQQAVLLAAGRGDDGAVALLAWLRGPEARRTMARFGYETVGSSR